ncbi:16S ribosomal RNA methyltransferase RsmE [Gluconacetobacter liquefaciens NRIC 0522]|uniref:Ribosomal RNA small subunit methyltransferase E n=1 Tax=Gluconacetobacter liquefaciens TaxID=89584 RepID=A0A370FXM6_GLULI|nr:16S rRNA (uracil(1498)-N(3))-methyltransferase [Gluconacetobacter liquefaciens]MBB2187412.1 16S rRNA (uracil(1498)-N(3))-methyltransferase [Gluconacetobacter liquefaciens]RDI36377.1 16S rRNA (uracil1498-N3)-methyltransferase [Gluconacetobacter liquefaciens]GBQ92107.1 16S ribosomal RNA methyltransferase RsmE [Gluconacetobacter liquefaciens NRIC 0522]
MKDCPRLFADPAGKPPMEADAVRDLEPGQAHYLGTVMRMAPGAEVALFNAGDGEWLASLVAVRRDRAQVQLLHRRRAPEPACGPVLLFAPLKRDATDMVVRMGTELGVTRFLPVLTERTNTHRVNVGRLEAIAMEAAEQCERLDVPTIGEPVRLPEQLAAWPAGCTLFVAAERDGPDDGVGEIDRVADGDGLLVGPEGGFSDAERRMLRARPFVRMITLGKLILRADTAAACGLSLMGAGFRRASGADSR